MQPVHFEERNGGRCLVLDCKVLELLTLLLFMAVEGADYSANMFIE
jgi:hypothetical protein